MHNRTGEFVTRYAFRSAGFIELGHKANKRFPVTRPSLELIRFSGHLTARFRGVHNDEEDVPFIAASRTFGSAIW